MPLSPRPPAPPTAPICCGATVASPVAPLPAAIAGYPHITLPMGMIQGLPVGISFFGRAWSEPKLLGIAYAFEQLTHARKAPRFIDSLEG